jgi:hypothetical protein
MDTKKITSLVKKAQELLRQIEQMLESDPTAGVYSMYVNSPGGITAEQER